MKKRLSLVLAVTIAAVLVLGLWAASAYATPQTEEETTTEGGEEATGEETVEVELLFVQHAEGVTLEGGVLTLKGIGEEVLYFSDRPHRIVGHEGLEDFLATWDEGEGSFKDIPPNAVLTVRKEDELRDVVVVLKSPVLADGNLVYQVEVLDGPESGSGDFAALFIDVVNVGRPMVGPTSPRGAARRTARRTARRVDRRQDVID